MENFIQEPGQKPKKNPIIKIVIALIILILLAGAGYYFIQSDGGFFKGLISSNVDQKKGENNDKKSNSSQKIAPKPKEDAKVKAKPEEKGKEQNDDKDEDAEAELREQLERQRAERAAEEAADRDEESDEEAADEESQQPTLIVEYDDAFDGALSERNDQIISRFKITATGARIELDGISLRLTRNLIPRHKIENIRLYANDNLIDEVRNVSFQYDIIFPLLDATNSFSENYPIEEGETINFYVMADILDLLSDTQMVLCIKEDNVAGHNPEDPDPYSSVYVNLRENNGAGNGACSVSEVKEPGDDDV